MITRAIADACRCRQLPLMLPPFTPFQRHDADYFRR